VRSSVPRIPPSIPAKTATWSMTGGMTVPEAMSPMDTVASTLVARLAETEALKSPQSTEASTTWGWYAGRPGHPSTPWLDACSEKERKS
jgi:hypothetical protein